MGVVDNASNENNENTRRKATVVPIKIKYVSDLLVLFTNTVSHKMVKCALDEVGASTDIVRCHTSSGNALNGILEARC